MCRRRLLWEERSNNDTTERYRTSAETETVAVGTDIRATDKGKRTEKTAQLSAGRQTAAEADKEEIQRHGAIRKVEQIMKKTIFKEMGGTYVRCGDYFIPCLTLPEEEEPRFVGVWDKDICDI